MMNANAEREALRTRDGLGALDQYLREIGRIPLLDSAQETALGERILAGDRTAVDELVRHNLRFVVAIARRYSRHGVPMEDLIDEGNIGLIQAAERFDVRRGFRFISYAVFWIRQTILRSLDQKSRLVRVPADKRRQLMRLVRAGECLPHTLGREPTLDEVARWVGIAPQRAETLRQLPTRVVCIDRPGEGEESQFDMDTLVDPGADAFGDRIDEDLSNRRLDAYLDRLDHRGADIVRRYYGLRGRTPETLEHIGQSYGVTRERARQLRDRAMNGLRTLLENETAVEA